MARRIVAPTDYGKNELQSPRIHNLASAPSSPVVGQMYMNTTDDTMYFWDGTAWISMIGGSVAFGSPGNSAVGDVADDGANVTAARSDHRHGREAFGAVTAQTSFGAASGNGSATTISHSDHTHGTPTHDGAAHSTISLSALAAPTGDVAWNSQKITGLATPTADGDAATKGYVDGVSQGLDIKGSVKAASTANLDLAGDETIDGVSITTGMRVLVKNQTDPIENGIYVSAAGAWGRAADADTTADLSPGSFVFVEEGTANADSGWVMTADSSYAMGTDPITWAQFSGAGQITAGTGLTKTGNTLNVGAGTGITVNADDVAINTAVVPRLFAASIGDGAATSYDVDHNLGTTDVIVQVFQNSDGAQVEPDITRTTVNRVVIAFTTAPASNAYRVICHG